MSAGEHTVGIIGAGTMGAGIAQVAATAGWIVELMDVDTATAQAAVDGVAARLNRLVEKGRMSADERRETAIRLRVAGSAERFSTCDLLLEAVVEDLDVKVKVIGGALNYVPDEAIIATNTSSLSITRLGDSLGQGRRTAGMHFFNPAPVMKLVEVIAGERTDPAVVDRVAAIAESWGKVTARAADVPGFIVNHVARPYYLEAFRILEDGLAGPAEIDGAMRAIGGFRMGPLELADLIGQDVNAATTRSVWEQLGKPPLLAPSPLQERLVAEGRLGRKTGRGIYSYKDKDAAPAPALEVKKKPLEGSAALRAAIDDFAAHAAAVSGDEPARYVFARILAALIAQAGHALRRGVATAADIDTALKYGTNYPLGPFEWARRIGHDRVARLLEALNEAVADGRFAMPALPAGV